MIERRHRPALLSPFVATLGLSVLSLASLDAKSEWNRFRGPNGSGQIEASNLPTVIDASNTVWKTPIGRGWSAPVLWQDKLFLTMELAAGKRALLCLDANTGKELWRHEVGFKEHRQHKFNSFASVTPFVDAKAVYIAWANGVEVQAMALDHAGKVLWHNDKVANYIHEHGYGISTLVAEGVMVIRSEFSVGKGEQTYAEPDQMNWTSAVVGLEAATGKPQWKLDLPNTINPFSTPVLRQGKNGGIEFIIANTTSGVMGIDLKTGKINWQHNPGFKQRSVASVSLAGDVVFTTFGSGDGGKESALLDLSSGKPVEIGSIIKNIPYVPTPLIIKDRLYMLRDGGILTCSKWPSGEMIYSERLTGGEGRSTKFFSSPVAADGKIFCASQTGEVIAVPIGDQFRILGVSKLDASINATPAIGADKIYIRTEKNLWCAGVGKAPVP